MGWATTSNYALEIKNSAVDLKHLGSKAKQSPGQGINMKIQYIVHILYVGKYVWIVIVAA